MRPMSEIKNNCCTSLNTLSNYITINDIFNVKKAIFMILLPPPHTHLYAKLNVFILVSQSHILRYKEIATAELQLWPGRACSKLLLVDNSTPSQKPAGKT